MHLKTPLMNSSNCKYLPIYIIRINLHDNKEKIKDFYKNNEIAILVNQDNEKEYWNYLYQSNNVTKTPKNIQFIQRWKKMEEVLQTSDILVIAKYLGEKKTKIAKISKNTKSIQRGKENEYKIYKLEDVKEFENLEYPILNSIIPHQVTLSPVKQREELIHWLFSEEKYEKPEISLKNISTNLVELICLEWLRSNLAPKDYKIQFQFYSLQTEPHFQLDFQQRLKPIHDLIVLSPYQVRKQTVLMLLQEFLLFPLIQNVAVNRNTRLSAPAFVLIVGCYS